MTPRWRKVLMDLWGNKVRTLLVVLSITVGVFSVGLVAGVYSVIKTDVPSDYRSVNPRDATIYTDLFDESLLTAARKVEGVGDVEGRASISVQVKSAGGQYFPIQVEAVPDSIDKIKINQLRLEQGAPALGEKEIFIERSSIGMLGLKVGDTVTIKLADDRTRDLRIVGLVHDVNAASYTFAQSMFGYVTIDTLEWMGGTRLYNRMMINTAARTFREADVQVVVDRVTEKIKKSGKEVYVSILSNPGQHPAQSMVDAVIYLNAGLGVLALLLSTFLVINTISAMMSQQVRQIGVMKSVGADSWQVMGLYLVLILVVSLIALAVAIPLAGALSYLVCQFIAGMINVNLAGFRITPLAITLQLIVGLLVPLGSSLGPVFTGSRMTVRQAISNYGLSTLGGRSWFDRLLENVRGLPRPLLISLRNTFRRKGRLALTLFTLVLGGAIFIAVLNARQAMYDALDITFGYILSDVNVDFGRGYRIERIQDALKGIPGIVKMEGWGASMAQAMKTDGKSGTEVVVIAPPGDSTLIKPVLMDGRWLLPGDENAIVVGNHFMKFRPETKVGDTLQIRVQGKDHPYKVVGIYKMAGNTVPPILYANYEYLADSLGQSGEIYSIRVSIENNSFVHQKEVADLLRARFKALGMPVGGIQTGGDLIQQNRFIVDILIDMLLIMALLIAVVGGLGLMGTMSMNVLERTREIGVMRSIGAVNGSIFQLVVTEGMIIGMISWGLGALLAIPITQVLNTLVGVSLLTVPLDYVFSYTGLILWLVIVIVLSGIASMLPARNAVRLTVRDVLAYE